MSGIVTAPPEAALWAVLDHLELPFRTPVGQLLAQHGQKPGWTKGLASIPMPGKPLVRGLSPFAVPLREDDDPTLPPHEIAAAFRSRRHLVDWLIDRRVYRNHATMLRTLQAMLGPGVDAASSNTKAREWRYGMARVAIMVFPPLLNRRRGQNQRFAADPGARYECSLRVHPGWLPQPGPDILAAVATYRRLGDAMAPFFDGWHVGRPWHRWPATAGTLPISGYGLAAAGLVAVAGDLLQLVPRANVLEVTREVLMPGRGSGQVELSVRHAPPGVTGMRPHLLVLARADYDRHGLLTEAQALATALAVPLRESVGIDA
ncbi:MAG: hypothetical protein ABI832_08305 [bacterium]